MNCKNSLNGIPTNLTFYYIEIFAKLQNNRYLTVVCAEVFGVYIKIGRGEQKQTKTHLALSIGKFHLIFLLEPYNTWAHQLNSLCLTYANSSRHRLGYTGS